MAEEKEYDLKKSIEGLGVLVPIIKNKRTGHTVDGRHREQLGFKTPIYEIDIPEELEPIARLAINNVRRNADKDEEEWRDTLSKFVGIEGKKPQELADLTGVSVRTIYRHLPQSLKPSGEKISEGLKKEYEIARQEVTPVTPSIKSPDKLQNSSKPTPQEQVECERCRTHVSKENIKPWHGHNLCDRCEQKAQFNPEAYDGYFRYLERAQQGKIPTKLSLPTKPQETWEQRKAQMTPQISKMEETILAKLHDKDVKPIVTERKFCLLETTPDFYFPSMNLAVYLDGKDVHLNRQDRDETLREMLMKRYGLKVLSIPYDGTSEKQAEQILAQIMAITKEA